MTASPGREDRLLSLIESLLLEFDSLSKAVRDQKQREKVLFQRLNLAADECEKFVTADGSSSTDSADPIQTVKNLRQPLPDIPDPPPSSVIQRVRTEIRTYRMANHKANNRVNGARCPVTGAGADPEDMELDFTTSGKQGNLGCPFARMAANGKANTTDGVDDPVAAEFHQDEASVRSPRTDTRPAGQCPIRFLDQHSPEEIAQYFENHKHEIPRSHEICVRRYQGNENSVRQLDAKYGNLVNMIQGLGVKHKAYLPEKDRIEVQDAASENAVERWADKVNSELAVDVDVDIEPSTSEEEHARVSRFDKPLREVRVGESPSRPWGISVPPDKLPAPSALQSEAGGEVSPAKEEQSEPQQRPTATCPVDHSKLNNQDEKPGTHPEERLEEKSRQPPTQIIFNGPVFFGYSAEQVAILLQSGNLGKMNTGSA